MLEDDFKTSVDGILIPSKALYPRDQTPPSSITHRHNFQNQIIQTAPLLFGRKASTLALCPMAL